MNLTYRQLIVHLKELSPEELDMSVTVSFGGEFFGVEDTCFSDEGILDAAADGVLDPGTPVLIIHE